MSPCEFESVSWQTADVVAAPRGKYRVATRRLSARRLPQRGAAALAVTLVLFFVMALVATFVNRNLIFEQRISANQYRSTQAFEAAEAGLQWAEAQLNANQHLGDDCRAVSDIAAISFRERYLQLASASGRLTPRTWDHAGVAAPLQPACVRTTAGWSCSCPADGDATLAAPAGAGPFPAFSLQLIDSGKAGIVRVVAIGCSALAPPCRPGAGAAADSSARIEVSLGLLGGLRVPPAAALTAAGPVDADTAAFVASNPDPATGIAIHAGGGIAASLARSSGAPGAPTAASRVEHDAALAALGSDGFFASYFGMGKAHWKAQPVVTIVDCHSHCAAALAQAVDDRSGSAMLWVEGDLELDGPVVLGSAGRPVVIVVNGTIRLHGAVAITGVLYAGDITWNDATGGASVRGALISERSYQGTAAPEFTYDLDLLNTLTGFAGSFARVSGSWRDF